MTRLIRGIRISASQAGFTLAEQRLEQIRATALGNSLVACTSFANITTATTQQSAGQPQVTMVHRVRLRNRPTS